MSIFSLERLTLLPGGHCYIAPTFAESHDFCSGRYGNGLPHQSLICGCVIAFSADATPFPGVDTNALVFCLRNESPAKHFDWVKCQRQNSKGADLFAIGR